jgi:hypothetical protein
VAKKQPKRTKTKRPSDVETLQTLVDQYEQVFDEVQTYIDLIRNQDNEISERTKVYYEAKEKSDKARGDLDASRDALAGTKHALFMFLRPGRAEILPLFDRMEKADEEKHGKHSDEWRKEPISALRLSLVATNVLTAADVLLVGQLQDRVQADANAWFEKIEGLTPPMAAAIADKLNDFIAEHSKK